MIFNNLIKKLTSLTKACLIIGCLLTLTSCSQTKLAYGFLDNWIRWQVNDYVDLNSQQSKILKSESKKFHQWHRNNELVRYSLFLNETIANLESPQLKKETVSETFTRLNQFIKSSTQQLHEPTIAIVASLSDEQVEEILKNIKKEDEKLKKSLSEETLEERTADQFKQTRKTFKSYLGSLTEEQDQLLENFFKEGQSGLQYNVERNENWLNDFTELMKKDLSQTENQQQIIHLFFNYPEYLNEEHRLVTEHNTQLFHNLIVDLHATLSKEQKDKLIKKMANYRDDFLELAGVSSDILVLKAEL
ncbi:DUF6279 family lipoprotein [Sessilibacter sp. MAH4]